MAERIVNEFTVNRPIGEAWPIICDLERIAPCMPGAQLEEIEGEIYRGRVKVKLGALATEFKGEAQIVERDDANHTAKLVGKGRDVKGRGNAAADIDASAEELSPTSTKVTVTANLNISGRVAQFSRGVMGDVSKKLIDEFSSNLNTMIDISLSDDAQPMSRPNPGSGSPSSAATPNPSVPSDDEQTTVRKINGPAAEPIDVADFAGGAILKRFGPIAVALLLLIFLVKKIGD